MQLSRFSDYSLRVLFYVAINQQQRSNLAEIAEFYSISHEHLRKVVHTLGKLEYLHTYRGKSGGISLGRPPEAINLGELLAQTEGTAPLIDCNGQSCRLAAHCRLQGVLAEAQSAFFAVLQQYSLADLVADRQMQAIIQVDTAE